MDTLEDHEVLGLLEVAGLLFVNGERVWIDEFLVLHINRQTVSAELFYKQAAVFGETNQWE